MINQLQIKHQLSILSLIGVIAVLGVLPFALIRYLEGNFTAALINIALVLGINHQQQHAFINNLRTTIKNELTMPDGKEITASFGVAAWVSGTTVDSWLKRADSALYQAKANGRDCAVFSDSEPAQ